MKEKVQEICTLIPAFKKEIDWQRGKTLEGKDYCKYVFKSGSYFDNIAARESSRGKRLQLAYRKQTQDTHHHNQSTARILKTDYKE